MTKASKTIATGLPTFSPLGVFQGPDEAVYVTTGLSRGLKWDRRSSAAVDIGIDQPRSGPSVLTPTGGNSGAGVYQAGYRWLDVALQPGSLSPLTSVTAAASDRFTYGNLQTAPSTRITTAHQGYVQFWRTAVDTSRVVYTVYGTGTAFSVSATANDEGYSQYTVSDVTGLRAGDVVVMSGHSNSMQDGQQTVLKVIDDDNTFTTDKGFVASGTGTATQRLFYFSYAGAIASHADSGGQVLFTTTLPHRLPVGAVILVSSSGVAGYNTTHKVRTVPTPFTFTTDQSFSAGTLGSSTTYLLTGFGNSTDNNDGDELSDADLTATSNISMTILNDDGELIARRFNPPPAWKIAACQHQDRAWYSTDAVYGGLNAAGQTMSVAVTQGDRTVTGTNTAFTQQMVGRYIHIDGEALPKLIQKVTSATVVEVDDAIVRASGSSLSFQVIPPPAERNKLYYSHPLEPESVPATNVVVIQDNTATYDSITGLIPHGAVLYVPKERTTYRVSYARQPRLDATPTLAYSRGMLNHRCFAVVDDDAYILDQSGIYMVPLWGSDHLSRDGVQHTVRPLLDFVYDNKLGLDKLRWSFVTLDSERRQVRFWIPQATWCSEYAYDTTLLRPKTCFVYNLDTQSFDLEGYPHQMGGGCLLPVNGRMRAILGGQRDLVYMMDDDLGEGIDTVLSGTVAAYNAGTPSITLASDPGTTLDGAPVCITAGPGKFQVRRAVSRSGAVVTLDQAFTTAPTTASTYRVGGVLCRARTGQFGFPDDSNSKKGDVSNKRGMRIAYQPFSDTFDVRFYLNHSSTAMSYQIGTNHGMGITTTADEPDAVVNAALTRSSHGEQPGYSIVEVAGGRLNAGSYGDRWMGVELRCVRGAARPKFYGMEIMGVIPHPGASGEK